MNSWEGTRRGDIRECATRVLDFLAVQPVYRTTKRIDIQREIFGSEFVRTYDVSDALKWLRAHECVKVNDRRGYSITAKGRDWLRSAEAFKAAGS